MVMEVKTIGNIVPEIINGHDATKKVANCCSILHGPVLNRPVAASEPVFMDVTGSRNEGSIAFYALPEGESVATAVAALKDYVESFGFTVTAVTDATKAVEIIELLRHRLCLVMYGSEYLESYGVEAVSNMPDTSAHITALELKMVHVEQIIVDDIPISSTGNIALGSPLCLYIKADGTYGFGAVGYTPSGALSIPISGTMVYGITTTGDNEGNKRVVISVSC